MKTITERVNFNHDSIKGNEKTRSEVSVRYIGSLKKDSEVFVRWIRDSLVKSMPRHEVNNYFDVKGDEILNSSFLSVASREGQCVGVIALSKKNIRECTILYVETILMAESFHRSGLAAKLINSVFQGVYNTGEGFPDCIAMKTYNPITYVMMKKFSRSECAFYPLISQKNSDENILLAKKISSLVASDCQLDELRGIVYGGGGSVSNNFWQDPPKSGDYFVDNFFQNQMTASDRVLCFININHEEDKQYVMSRLGIK